MDILKGTEITRMATINSIFAQGNVTVKLADGTKARINVEEIVKMVNEFEFELNTKTNYTYLANPVLVKDTK